MILLKIIIILQKPRDTIKHNFRKREQKLTRELKNQPNVKPQKTKKLPQHHTHTYYKKLIYGGIHMKLGKGTQKHNQNKS